MLIAFLGAGGGIESLCFNVVDALSKTEDITVLGSREKSDIIEGIDFIDGRRASSPIINFFASVLALKDVNLSGFDAVICSTWRTALIARLLLLMHRTPYFVLIHGNDMLNPSTRTFRTKIENMLRRNMLRNAAGVIANSNYTLNLCTSLVDEHSVTVIHPPISYCETPPAQERPSGCLRLFSLGRLEERKGIQHVLAAIKEMLSEDPEANVIYRIGGSGPFEEELRNTIEAFGIQGHAEMLGRLSEEEKAWEFSWCDAFIMPSFYIPQQGSVEGFGIVFLEANMYGKPVIATASGGIPDAVIPGKTGILTEEGDVEELSRAIRALYDGSMSFDSTSCKEWAARHDASCIAEQYKNFISSILGK